MESFNALDLELDMGDDMDCDLPVPSLEYDMDMDVDVLQDTPSGTFAGANPSSATPPRSPFTPTSASASDTSLISHASGDPVSQQTNHATPSAQSPRFDPRALLNPTAPPSTSKRPASSGEDADRGRTEIAPPGQVSLVERLHNVHERTASPAKRVKTDEQKKRASSGFGSGALDLGQGNGQHLQHSNGHHPVAKQTAVDLTMSDDDDVQVVDDNGQQEICIGRLEQTYVMMHTVPFPDPKKYTGNHGAQTRIKVSFRRLGGKNNITIMVTDPTGREFGKVDAKTANAIAPLLDSAPTNGMKWMAWTDPRRKAPGEGPSGSPHSSLVSMTLQLYCPRKNAEGIGRFLLSRKVKLAAPTLELSKYDYFNPQTRDHANKAQLSQHAMDPTFAHSVPGATTNYVLRSVDEIRADVQNVFDTVVVNSEAVPMREPSSHIKTELYPHQKQALHFMWNREQDLSGAEEDDRVDPLWKAQFRNGRKSFIHVITGEEVQHKPKSCRGGVLADEMGLGKTLSVLSLIADTTCIDDARQFATKKPPPLQPGSKSIQPLINSRATLLVCPLSTMTNWREQIKDHFPVGSALKWTRYHGSERFDVKPQELANYDIVVTTYHIIAKDLLDKKRALPYINWFRIVLDEAHTIRNPTAQSKATCALWGQRRWAVTGTPVQNRLEDLGALFNFIRLTPFDTTYGFNNYIISPFKAADPEVVPKLQLLVSTVTIRRTKEIIKNEVPARNDLTVRLQFSKEEQQLHDWFERDTQRKVNAVTAGEKMGGHSYVRILTAILNLRLICAHGRDLLSDEALKTTDGMTYSNPMEIGEEDEETPALNRQQAYEMLDLLDQTSTDNCAYCQKSCLAVDSDDEDDDGEASDVIGYMTPCYHIVCPKHIKKLKTDWKNNTSADNFVMCSFCEDRVRPVTFELRHSDYRAFNDERERIRRDPKLSKKIGSYTGPHTKTQALLNDLQEHREWSDAHPDERPIKSVVFSTWTTHLDLIEIALKSHSHPSVRLDGRMSRDARDKSMATFRADPSIRVLLVSIGAGGLGLNLTTANKVFMMEPQFNPAAEAQAVDRVHRLGQDREVTIKRFIMDKSFEEKMLVLQGKKKALADLTMAREKRTKGEATKQRLEELRSLFR